MLRTEIEKLKVSLVEKQVRETTTSESCHQIKMICEVTNLSVHKAVNNSCSIQSNFLHCFYTNTDSVLNKLSELFNCD